MWKVASYVLGQKLRRNARYPLVLMLEPLFRCNLSCAGCGKIQYPANILKTQLSVEECLKAVDECPAPIVAIPGGEPLLHPDIKEIVEGIVARGRFVYLCTNALLLEQNIDRFAPTPYLTFSVHMDGLQKEHDFAVCREGTYEKAYRAVEEALRRGFRVTTNTTLFDGADPERTRTFFDEMMTLGVEGMMVSPGYSYEKAPDQEHFLGREKTRQLFRKLLYRGKRGWRFNQSPLFLEFLAGSRQYECTPWGNPTYNVFGWQKPCYLLQEGYADSFGDLMKSTEWSNYGHASGNPSCQNCMVHSGFEASAVDEAFSSPRGMISMIRATLFGPRVEAPEADHETESLATGEGDTPTQGYETAADDDALRVAFHYRGDVTLTLDDGSAVEGYVSKLEEASLRLWRRGSTETQTLPIARVKHIKLSGRDAAAGKSFEAWAKKQAQER
jgi:hopanoid biosynthesis associated radical SAM protein HpnH